MYSFKIQTPSVLALLSLLEERTVRGGEGEIYTLNLTVVSSFSFLLIFLLTCSLAGWAAEESSCHLSWGRLQSSWADCQLTSHCRWWLNWATQAGGSWRYCLPALKVSQHHLLALWTVCTPPVATVNLALQPQLTWSPLPARSALCRKILAFSWFSKAAKMKIQLM